ncbi:TerB N-terminal domain-containing protein [Sinirhodobacter huangdaonensis]|nr:TerB N-terminal domain-containing protein [Sinirhodobacter huangdaonensis]
MLAFLVKLIRMTLFYAVYFVLGVALIATVLKDLPAMGQMLFAFGVPLVLVWVQENRRRGRSRAREELGAVEAFARQQEHTAGSRAAPPPLFRRGDSVAPAAAEAARGGRERIESEAVRQDRPVAEDPASPVVERSAANPAAVPAAISETEACFASNGLLPQRHDVAFPAPDRSPGPPAPPPLSLTREDPVLPEVAQTRCAQIDAGEAAVLPSTMPVPKEPPLQEMAESDLRLRDREALRAQQERAERYRLAESARKMARQKELEEEGRAARKLQEGRQRLENQLAPAKALTSWVPKGESAVIVGRHIGGMVYVGPPPRIDREGYSTKSRPYIDPALPVARLERDPRGTQLPYWPSYSDLSPICRATYLDWLADGRRDASYNPGYMFLYFYGLERRFCVDLPEEEEKRKILDEVRRLAALYDNNGSARRYLGEFIGIAQLDLQDPAASEPVLDFRGWEVPFGLKVAIGSKIAQDEPLSWDWVLSWLICHPEHYLRTPATRCQEEFRALFRLRFERRFPNGLKVAKPRKMLSGRYQAASQEFHADLKPNLGGRPVPDISGLRKPLEIAQEVADEVTEALERFSRYLGRIPDGRGSIEAQALLPAELRPLFPSDALDRLKDWAASQVAEGALVPAAEVIARIGGTLPEKLTKSLLTGAADTLARIGFGLAPDPRFALRSPKIDEPLVIYALEAPIENLEDVSAAYRAALLELALGVFVVQADGVISDAERRALRDRIERAADISAAERLRLAANMDWLLAVPSDLALLRRKLKETGPDVHVALRAALVAAAHADGLIQSEEVARIEKLYKALGLDPGLVYSDIHAGDVLDDPVRVKPATADVPGEAIPTAVRGLAHKLDPALIAATRAETARVSSVLGAIFGAEEAEPETAPVHPEESVRLQGLDAATTALVREIAGETHLTAEAFEAACKRHGFLPAGALEAINEWAFGIYDEALLDDYDGYDVAPEIAAAVTAEFAKEGRHVHA